MIDEINCDKISCDFVANCTIVPINKYAGNDGLGRMLETRNWNDSWSQKWGNLPTEKGNQCVARIIAASWGTPGMQSRENLYKSFFSCKILLS